MRPSRRQRGNALIEYIILLIAVAIVCLSVVTEYGRSVDAKWRGADDSSGPLDDVAGGLGGENAPCGYYYNAATGRWHDPETHLFVSFDDASAAGCS